MLVSCRHVSSVFLSVAAQCENVAVAGSSGYCSSSSYMGTPCSAPPAALSSSLRLDVLSVFRPRSHASSRGSNPSKCACHCCEPIARGGSSARTGGAAGLRISRCLRISWSTVRRKTPRFVSALDTTRVCGGAHVSI